ncbi:phosphate signaling complex protein PhoU [Macrococcus armenti]|uniref:phosphate signaling complex protein PhoU n=1 Tax=Macrococcus armenti TaxID=2875764 RepID=UPI001CC9C169|nr:phosphate signaling complex protein PhoU [Macrococcus armenti]UBH14484.1 phosphate signaling complex protein PhoU [Macrococcus armenti]UBH18886.1 phosphate signaling complex protein PhoU [Macrococcus armenti]UBH19107.1 phosphate signaling complex protein PhoU [Macrococcus armenti]
MVNMREIYEESLQHLENSVMSLADDVYRTIEKSINVLSDDNKDIAREIIANDVHINAKESDIENQIISLITKQQPIATDLRMILSSSKIASELERMGDNASNIAKIRKRVKIEDTYILARLNTMGKLSMLMLADLKEAYAAQDVNLVKEIIERDNDIDDLYKEIINSSYLIDNDPYISGQAHLAGRYLERIGDHITNIAESVYFTITGERFS